jgi:hypothetical protein
VFSLGYQRRRPGHDKVDGGGLRPAGQPGRFHLHTPEYTALQALVKKL